MESWEVLCPARARYRCWMPRGSHLPCRSCRLWLGLDRLSTGWLSRAGAGARLYPRRRDLQPHHREMFLTFDTKKALKGWGRACGQSPLQGISSSSFPSLNDADKVGHWLTRLQPNVLWISWFMNLSVIIHVPLKSSVYITRLNFLFSSPDHPCGVGTAVHPHIPEHMDTSDFGKIFPLEAKL